MKVLSNNLRFMMFIFIVILLLAVSVQATTNSPPVIDSVYIDPENPTKYNDLTCFVDVSDPDGNLDYVDFKWYVNGVLTKENTKLVYGSSDSTSDTLDSFHTDPWDYVVCQARAYDFDKAYDYETHAVRVGNIPANSMPTVSYVDITPRHPNPQQDLTCSILAMDTDDNLDHVIFRWERNGYLIRSAAKNMEGSSDTAQDILLASYTYADDSIKCIAEVYDTYGAKDSESSLPVVISDQQTTPSYPPYYPPSPPYTQNRKPIAVLTANKYYVDEDEEVYFSGFRSYDPDGYILQYKFDYGDGHQSVWLSSNTPYSYHAYSEDGTYYAMLKVKDDEYLESDWSNPVLIRVRDNGDDDNPEIEDMDIFRKYYDNNIEFTCEVEVFDEDEDLDYVRFKWYVDGELFKKDKEEVSEDEDEAESEMNLMITEDYYTVKCEATVYDEERNSDTAYRTATGYLPGPDGKDCEITVNRFDYYSYLTEGKKGWVEIEIENTGERSGTLTIELYVDGSLKGEYTEYLRTGEKTDKRFEFPLSVGTHNIRIESYLPCSESVTKFTEITVFPLESEVFIPEEEDEEEPEITETNVIIRPTSLDIELNSGKTLDVIIESPELANFEISVKGIPEDWVNYPKEVDVEGRKTFYIYIVPKDVGNYDFEVEVETDGKTFEENIRIYVAPASGEVEEEEMDGLTGLISLAQSNWLIGAVIISLLVLLTALYFVAGKFKKKTYEEHIYGAPAETPAQPPAYQARMMKGSMGNPDLPNQRREVDMSRLLPAEILKYTDGTYYPKQGGDFEHRQSDTHLGESFGPIGMQ